MAVTWTVGSLFSGIGGIDLGLARAGFETRWFCETDDYCRRVLAKHWPGVPCYGDIRTVDFAAVECPDVLAGGFPCQPVSLAGKRAGAGDARWLWPEFARAIRALRPRYVLVENVPGLFTAGFGAVLGDLATSGYDAEWDCVSAASVGAPHIRERVFVVAYPASVEGRGIREPRIFTDARTGGYAMADAARERCERAGDTRDRRAGFADHGGWAVEPALCRVVDGFPGRVDRLRALGNAVVPACVEVIGAAIAAQLRGGA